MLALGLIYAEVIVLSERGKYIIAFFFFKGLNIPSTVRIYKIINTCVSPYLTSRVLFPFSSASSCSSVSYSALSGYHC